MSFQIVDDILDFTSTEKKLGKPVGSDLMNGHITLPVLLEIRKNPEFKQHVAALTPNSPKEDFNYCIDVIRNSDSINEAQAVSDKYLNKAVTLINSLNNKEAQTLFNKLIQKMSKRNV